MIKLEVNVGFIPILTFYATKELKKRSDKNIEWAWVQL